AVQLLQRGDDLRQCHPERSEGPGRRVVRWMTFDAPRAARSLAHARDDIRTIDGIIAPMQAAETKSLPQNAYVTLGAGENYEPMVLPAETAPETTVRSVAWGLFLCIVFTVAS